MSEAHSGFEYLLAEHPTLSSALVPLVEVLRSWQNEVRPAPGGNAWGHHYQFAQRTERLGDDLDGVLTLSNRGRHHSALALVRTALEHHLLDRLVLLADRYEEIVPSDDPEEIAHWETEWVERSKAWTRDVVEAEKTRSGKALRLTRRGYPVSGGGGEHISPYWVAMEHYDAFIGHPDQQEATVRPFDDLDARLEWAKRNQSLYGDYMRWSSICRNLALNNLVEGSGLVQLQVHYAFLSAFTHASQSAYDLRARPGGPTREHVLGELALLYSGAIATAEIDAWCRYIGARPGSLKGLRPELLAHLQRARGIVEYFWFLGGRPQDFDRYQEANRRAHPRLLVGELPEVAPHGVLDEDIGYYGHPYERLMRMHTGEREGTTGFAFAPIWSTLHW